MEKSKEYRISYNKFADNKYDIKIRNSNSNSIDIYTGTKPDADDIVMRLAIAVNCVVDYINSLDRFKTGELSLMAAIVYHSQSTDEYCIEISKYSDLNSIVSSIKQSENTVIGKTMTVALIGGLNASELPVNFISKAEFKDIDYKMVPCSTLEEYYKSNESLLCRLV